MPRLLPRQIFDSYSEDQKLRHLYEHAASVERATDALAAAVAQLRQQLATTQHQPQGNAP